MVLGLYPHFFYNGIKYDKGGNQFVCVEVLRPSQPNRVMLSAVSLSYHTFTGRV